MDHASPTPKGGADATGSRRWLALAGICTAAGMVWLAFADLGVAIPTVADAFSADISSLQWANNAFSLVAGALVITAGKFGDVFGRRRMLQLGIVLFAGLSVVAASAQGVGALILGRGLMGVGAAFILPATPGADPTPVLRQGRAHRVRCLAGGCMGRAGRRSRRRWRRHRRAGMALAVLAQPAARGARLPRHPGPEPRVRRPEASRRVDWLGFVTIGLAVFALLYALTDGPSAGWGDPLVIGLLVAAVVLAVLWIGIERRVREPLVDLSLFRLRPYDGALVANLTMNLAFAGLSYVLVLWLQNARGYDAVEAGLLMLPSTLGIFLFIPLGSRADARRGGRKPVLIGLVVMSIGLLLLGFLDTDSGLGLLAIALVVVGLGLGLLSTPISDTAVGGVPGKLAGTAAGVFKMSSMVGGALGVAVLTAFARAFTTNDADDTVHASGLSADNIDEAKEALVQSSSFQEAIASLPEDVARRVTDAVVDAFSTGVARSAVVTGLVVLAAAGSVAVLWPRQNRGTTPPLDPLPISES